MNYIKGIDRGQLMMPESLEAMIGETNTVHVIDAFVDSLDLSDLGFQKAEPAYTGRPAYDPKDLLKLYIYGYLNRIRSSRRLMLECTRNIELFYLLRCLTPDFRTIADFRKENPSAIKKVFVEFVGLCRSLDFYGDEMAIDGSKFRANNGRKKMYNQNILDKKLERINGYIQEYLQKMDEIDKQEQQEEPLPSKKELKEALAQLLTRKETYEAYKEELKESGETQKLTTDPEARLMKTKDGFHCCYNVQTAVDKEKHLIAGYQVTNECNDHQVLDTFSADVKKGLDRDVLRIVADKGYDSQEKILNCVMNAIIPYVGFKYDKEERVFNLEYEQREITEKVKASKEVEDIQACLKAGVLPDCYQNTNIHIEVQNEGSIGCFQRNPDGTVTCPMGFELFKQRKRGDSIVYGRRSACRQCTNRCTPSSNLKTVKFGPNTEYVAARMYGAAKQPIITPPPGFIPNNSFFIKERIERKVVIKIRDDVQRQKERLCISEHPFGTIKWHDGAHYVLCREIEKTSAELGLSYLAYNLRRAINLVGINKILDQIQVNKALKQG